jgi:hypothetical protein
VAKLARILISQRPGDRLRPIHEYAEEFDTGVGTTHAATAYLQRTGAVALDRRGHLGTFVREIDYPKLWRLCGQSHIVGGMPLPYSRRLEGLATGLYEAFGEAGVALNLVYSRGAHNRLQALSSGHLDFALLSRFAFDRAVEGELAIEEVLGLGERTYVGQHIILLADPCKEGIEDGMRVGIDPTSIDQVLLTRHSCRGKEVEFVETSYMNLMVAMEQGRIDATIWNGDDFSASSSRFRAMPLVESGQGTSQHENTEAVLVVERGNLPILRTLNSIINRERIRETQRQVMHGERAPVY